VWWSWLDLAAPSTRPGEEGSSRDRWSLVRVTVQAQTRWVDRAGLADFLRRRREALQPADVGLGAGQRRRTAGLRREEVAALCAMSTDYYARLEQQRGPQPSEQMVAAVARGLRLTLDERDHLFRLVGHSAPTRVHRSDHVSPGLMRVLDRLEDTPAQVVSDLGETLVQNGLAAALLGVQTGHPGIRRYSAYRWFADPVPTRPYPVADHELQTRLQVADLRAAVTRRGSDARAAELVRGLLELPAAREVWERHEVAVRTSQHKTIRHPQLGDIELDCELLFTEDRSQRLLVFTAPRAPRARRSCSCSPSSGRRSGRAEVRRWRLVRRGVAPESPSRSGQTKRAGGRPRPRGTQPSYRRRIPASTRTMRASCAARGVWPVSPRAATTVRRTHLRRWPASSRCAYDGPGRHHYRLFCRLDYVASGVDKPLLVVIAAATSHSGRGWQSGSTAPCVPSATSTSRTTLATSRELRGRRGEGLAVAHARKVLRQSAEVRRATLQQRLGDPPPLPSGKRRQGDL